MKKNKQISLLGGLLFVVFIPSFSLAAVFPGTSWAKATPENQGMDSAKLTTAVNYIKNRYLTNGYNSSLGGMVIIRNGYEVYNSGDNNSYTLYSAGKSLGAIVAGKLIEEGHLANGVNTLASSWEPKLMANANYKLITLKHFLNLTSGYDAVNPDHKNKWGNLEDDWSITPFNPAPSRFAPGTSFLYWDDATHMMYRVLTQVTAAKLNQSVDSYLRSKIANPIGFTSFTGTKISAEFPGYAESQINGVDIYDEFIKTSASQFARVGHLLLNKGNWNGNQLLKSAFVEEMTKNQVSKSIPLYRDINPDPTNFLLGDHGDSDGRGVFGYMLWVNDVNSGGKRQLPDAPASTYYANGGWSVMFVIPDWNMVIARTGEHQPLGGIETSWNETLRLIGQSINSAPSVPTGLNVK